ncbi:hypothetical protein AA21952_1422 [Acetobacter oeni LMG 21952]|nr:hypothetical protein AA21952_1422 [Acetobacter oeni LMG 21952]
MRLMTVSGRFITGFLLKRTSFGARLWRSFDGRWRRRAGRVLTAESGGVPVMFAFQNVRLFGALLVG